MLRSVNKVIQGAWRSAAPDPLDVLREDLGLPLNDALLHLAQRAWCARYGREPLPQFVVHDAVHYLLGAAPTPKGECMVAIFQRKHLVYDRNFFGALAIMIAGSVLARRRVLGMFSRELTERQLGMRARIEQLVETSGAYVHVLA